MTKDNPILLLKLKYTTQHILNIIDSMLRARNTQLLKSIDDRQDVREMFDFLTGGIRRRYYLLPSYVYYRDIQLIHTAIRDA